MLHAPKSLSASSQANLAISIADLFAIGIGPSSSHTVGPMKAAHAFASAALAKGRMPARIQCTLYGSLALTGIGHATDKAILLGLSGWLPDTVDPMAVNAIVDTIRAKKSSNWQVMCTLHSMPIPI